MKINIVFLVLLIAKFYLVNNQEADMNTFIENLINSSQDLKQEKQEIESIVFGKKRNLSRMRQINLGFSSNQLSFKQVNSTTNDSNNSFNNSYSKPFEPKRKGFWLKIKSTSFLNKITYPDTPLATKIHNLEFDDEGFKINEKAKRYLASKLIKNKINIQMNDFYFKVNEEGIIYQPSIQDLNIQGFIDFFDMQSIYLNTLNEHFSCVSIKTNSIYYICQEALTVSKDMDSTQSEINQNQNKLKTKSDILEFYCSVLFFLKLKITKLDKNEEFYVKNDFTYSNDGSIKEYRSINLDNLETTCEEKSNLGFYNGTTIIKNLTIQPIVLVPIPTEECNHNWNYFTNGNDWECMCNEGKQQSPISILNRKITPTSEKPFFSFEKVDYKKENTYITLKNNVFIIDAYFGKIVKPDSSVYHCNSLKIHTGQSEHIIDNNKLDMEIQLICEGRSVGDLHKKVVLSFLISKQAGKFNSFIDSLDFFSFPSREGMKIKIKNSLYIPDIFYDSSTAGFYKNKVESSIPLEEETGFKGYKASLDKRKKTDDDIEFKSELKPFSFYSYEGSLSYPPCTESVTYYVVSDVIGVSSTLIDLAYENLRESTSISEIKKHNMGTKSTTDYSNINTNKEGKQEYFLNEYNLENVRDIQLTNNRIVYFWDKNKHCSRFELGLETLNSKSKKVNKGHYEKLKERRTDYIYVKGNLPSNLPNSHIVTEEEALKSLGDKLKLNKLSDQDIKELSLN